MRPGVSLSIQSSLTWVSKGYVLCVIAAVLTSYPRGSCGV